jgi:hypothetical protein
LGLQTEKRKSKQPVVWGKKGVCNNIYMLDDLVINKTADVKEMWLDMQSLGAPKDWSGKLALTLYMEDICPNRSLDLEVLAVADKLPAGAQAAKPVQLGKLQTAVIEIKKIQGAPSVKTMQSLGNLHATKLTMTPLKTTVHTAWDDKNLYFHYTAEEIPGRKPNTEGSKINKPWFCDSVECFFASGSGEYYQFIFGTGDRIFDAHSVKGKMDSRWTSKAIVKSSRSGDNWECEAKIPLSELKFTPAMKKGTFKVNFSRNHYRRKKGTAGKFFWEQTGWQPTYGAFSKTEKFGTLNLK